MLRALRDNDPHIAFKSRPYLARDRTTRRTDGVLRDSLYRSAEFGMVHPEAAHWVRNVTGDDGPDEFVILDPLFSHQPLANGAPGLQHSPSLIAFAPIRTGKINKHAVTNLAGSVHGIGVHQ